VASIFRGEEYAKQETSMKRLSSINHGGDAHVASKLVPRTREILMLVELHQGPQSDPANSAFSKNQKEDESEEREGFITRDIITFTLLHYIVTIILTACI
jgi:hypothetical protein